MPSPKNRDLRSEAMRRAVSVPVASSALFWVLVSVISSVVGVVIPKIITSRAPSRASCAPAAGNFSLSAHILNTIIL